MTAQKSHRISWLALTLAVPALLILFSAATTAQTAIMTSTDEVVESTSLLGTPTRLVLSCKDVMTSMAWWARLGFLPVADSPGKLDSALTMTDGQIVITLTIDVLPSPILMYSTPNIRGLKDTLEAMNVNITYDVDGPSYGELRLLSPNGVHIAVRPDTYESEYALSGDSNRLCGKLTELAIGTGFLKREKTYWEQLDFKVKRTSDEPYNYALLTDGVVTIGMHENRDIQSLTLTYFAENMPERMKNIKTAGIDMDDEGLTPEGRVDSGILTSPDGQVIFLFKGNQ